MSKKMIEYGFVAEPHGNGFFMYSPATKNGEEITCHDPSGFSGSWPMKHGGMFFASESNKVFCQDAMKKAKDYCDSKNSHYF